MRLDRKPRKGKTMKTFEPTHKIILRNSEGEADTIAVMLDDNGAAYTKHEWDTDSSADWECGETGEWLCNGQAVPSGYATVEITAV